LYLVARVLPTPGIEVTTCTTSSTWLANLTKQGLDQLAVLVKSRLKRMQYRPGLIDGFLAKTWLDLTLP
jgi:hypothetical protein